MSDLFDFEVIEGVKFLIEAIRNMENKYLAILKMYDYIGILKEKKYLLEEQMLQWALKEGHESMKEKSELLICTYEIALGLACRAGEELIIEFAESNE